MIALIVAVLENHHLSLSSGIFKCTCKEKVYGKSRALSVESHDIHVAQQLKAAGMAAAPTDPREAFLTRQNLRNQR